MTMHNSPTSGFSISAVAIRQHIGTFMLTLAVVVVGIFFISTLQVDLLPSITYPWVGVRLNVPGVSPEVAVDEVTKPLEEALSATENVVQVYSQTREGQVSWICTFAWGVILIKRSTTRLRHLTGPGELCQMR
jgi:multidrug efflux pump subunit AcrB